MYTFYVINNMEGAQVPEIWDAEDEKCLSVGHLKYRKPDTSIQRRAYGIFIHESPDYKNRPEIESASQFESACNVNGKTFKVIITVRKGIDDIAKFRYYTLKNVKFLPA